MNEPGKTPGKSWPIIIAVTQDILIVVGLYFAIQASRLDHYQGGLDNGVYGLIPILSLVVIVPLNIILSSYFLITQRKNYSKKIILFIVLSLILSLLFVIATRV